MVEFQPSSYGRGTYLNVGASWFWKPSDFLAFDLGYRLNDSWVEDDGGADFLTEVTRLAERAADRVQELRLQLRDYGRIGEVLEAEQTRIDSARESRAVDWHRFYSLGIVWGLHGAHERAAHWLSRLLAETPEYDWHRTYIDHARSKLLTVQDAGAFRADVFRDVQATRARERFRPLVEDL